MVVCERMELYYRVMYCGCNTCINLERGGWKEWCRRQEGGGEDRGKESGLGAIDKVDDIIHTTYA